MLMILRKRLFLKRAIEEEMNRILNSQIKSLLKEMVLEFPSSRPSIEEVADRWNHILQDRTDSVPVNEGFFRQNNNQILNASGLQISEFSLVLVPSLQWLYLDSNLLTKIPSFECVPQLRGLSLARNYITKI